MFDWVPSTTSTTTLSTCHSSPYSLYHPLSCLNHTTATTSVLGFHHSATRAYTCTCTSVAPYSSMKIVQECTEEAGKNGANKSFSNLGLGDFIWVQVIQAKVFLNTSSYCEASPSLYGMLLHGLKDSMSAKVKNIPEECTMRYSAKCDTQLLAHILHLFKKVSH